MKRVQIYNIENAFYNVMRTFLNKFVVSVANFYKMGKGCHELHELSRIKVSFGYKKLVQIRVIRGKKNHLYDHQTNQLQ